MDRMRTVAVIRGVIAALFAGLAVASVASGRIVFGVLFAGLAVANVAFVITMRRRRAELRQRFGAGLDRGPRRVA